MSDLISRQAAQKLICEDGTRLEKDGVYELTMCAVKQWVVDLLDELPSAEPERKVGKWLLTIEDWNKWTCSECGFSKRTDIHVTLGYDYCPKCGAKMEVDG